MLSLFVIPFCMDNNFTDFTLLSDERLLIFCLLRYYRITNMNFDCNNIHNEVFVTSWRMYCWWQHNFHCTNSLVIWRISCWLRLLMQIIIKFDVKSCTRNEKNLDIFSNKYWIQRTIGRSITSHVNDIIHCHWFWPPQILPRSESIILCLWMSGRNTNRNRKRQQNT